MRMKIETSIIVDGTADDIFALLLALDQYGDWLPCSGVHKGMALVSPGPVQEGSTYVDRQRGGPDMHGEVCVCDRPNRLAFRQQAKLPIGLIVVHAVFELQAVDDKSTRVLRTQDFAVPWPVMPLTPIFKRVGRSEGQRVLGALKQAVESGNIKDAL